MAVIKHVYRLTAFDNLGDRCSSQCFNDFDAAQNAFALKQERGSASFCRMELRVETWVDGEYQDPDEFGTDSDLIAEHVFSF